MNELNNKDGVGEILTTLVDEWATFMLHGESPDGAVALSKAAQALEALYDQQMIEARLNELDYVDGAATYVYASGGIMAEGTVAERREQLNEELKRTRAGINKKEEV